MDSIGFVKSVELVGEQPFWSKGGNKWNEFIVTIVFMIIKKASSPHHFEGIIAWETNNLFCLALVETSKLGDNHSLALKFSRIKYFCGLAKKQIFTDKSFVVEREACKPTPTK